MGKPSIFNNDYHKIMRRRKIVFRSVILLSALAIIIVTYDKSMILKLRKLIENINISPKTKVEQPSKGAPDSPQVNENKNVEDANMPKEQEQPKTEQGEFVFKLSDNENISLVYEKAGDDSRFKGIKPDNTGVFFDIRDDGKAIVFDNPRTSDIWIYFIDGKFSKLNPDNYKEYKKNDIMASYNNVYVWASRPKFLKDGRIIYQSNLPWFLKVNSYYLWVVNNDGSRNRMFMETKQGEVVKYHDFNPEGNLVIEFGGSKYTFNVDERSKQKID